MFYIKVVLFVWINFLENFMYEGFVFIVVILYCFFWKLILIDNNMIYGIYELKNELVFSCFIF